MFLGVLEGEFCLTNGSDVCVCLSLGPLDRKLAGDGTDSYKSHLVLSCVMHTVGGGVSQYFKDAPLFFSSPRLLLLRLVEGWMECLSFVVDE